MKRANVDEQATLRERQIQILYDNTRHGGIPVFVAGALFSGFYLNSAKPSLVLVWLTAYLALAAVHVFMQIKQARSRRPDGVFWLQACRRWAVAMSCVWALAVFIIPPNNELISLLFAAFWVASVASAGAYAFSIDLKTSFAFSAPANFALMFVLLSTSDPVTNYLAAGVLTYLVYSSYLTVQSHRTMMRDLKARLYHERLLESVRRERDRAEQLNGELADEMERRQKIERELRDAYEQAERLSALDPLTGIANRRTFTTGLENEWGRGRREGRSLAIVICDVDFFKPFNDYYGHIAGDECLQSLAKILRDSCKRGGDLVARYGGEEFVIMLPKTTEEQAIQLAEQIREALTGAGLEHKASPIADIVTASFGVAAVVPKGDDRPENLIGAADLALYQAKSSGRNCVMGHAESVQALDSRFETDQLIQAQS